ncbi:class I SAM-dependent methyltransferase [Kribbella speibonae]|uniref:Methyltransferase domain-containing protein n=1 Tax=Kribbella speibonae TaxID=1572660 RepID=A0A4R0IJU4_9ACTN|nr:class I SAM-dependent methyltransferase [Kribbella speibonae]TCC22748.1 methyltransferase domain-containing protein [Kribbella speibonae]TCC28975.1 methyltransferase domain-containing protein [Kribbella speibonae]
MDRTNALVERIFRNAGAALELYSIYLGERLGLYQSLAQQGPATSVELAERTGTNERYIREWLEHHAASGLVDIDDVTAAPTERRYTLPPEHVPVLADPDHVDYHGYKGVELARAARMLPGLVEAYRTGGAPPPLPWAPEGRADPNRASYLNLLGEEWLPAIPEIDERLRADPPARVADFACGTGWSSIAMAKAYPRITVQGVDLDEAAIAAATDQAIGAGLGDRVTFSVADAATQSGQFDLVTILEALHDMPRPVDALRTARQMLAPGGTVLIADELVEEEFTAPASDVERYHYGWSLMSCLPSAMGDPESAATGAVMRPATLRRYATDAGFTEVQVLPFRTTYWRFYRLIP